MKDIEYLDLCFDWGKYNSQEQLTLLQLYGFYKLIGSLADLRALDLRCVPASRKARALMMGMVTGMMVVRIAVTVVSQGTFTEVFQA